MKAVILVSSTSRTSLRAGLGGTSVLSVRIGFISGGHRYTRLLIGNRLARSNAVYPLHKAMLPTIRALLRQGTSLNGTSSSYNWARENIMAGRIYYWCVVVGIGIVLFTCVYLMLLGPWISTVG